MLASYTSANSNDTDLTSAKGASATGVTVSSPSQVNPLAPLALLPPDISRQAFVALFVLVGSLAVLLWDILDNLRSDYLLLMRRKITLPTIVYFLSRITNLSYQLGTVIISTAPLTDCRTTNIIVTSLFPIAIPSSGLLLLFQVRALYTGNTYFVAFLGFMWLALVASCSVAVIAAASPVMFGPIKCSGFSNIKPYVSAPSVVVLFNDTLLFFSIVFKVFQCSMAGSNDLRTAVKTFLFGSCLPTLSKALLKNGQVYFLSSVGLNFITVVIYYIDTIPPTYHLVMGVPNIVLMNIMACRIYRDTKLGRLDSSLPSPSDLSDIVFKRSGAGQTDGVVITLTRGVDTPPSIKDIEV